MPISIFTGFLLAIFMLFPIIIVVNYFPIGVLIISTTITIISIFIEIMIYRSGGSYEAEGKKFGLFIPALRCIIPVSLILYFMSSRYYEIAKTCAAFLSAFSGLGSITYLLTLAWAKVLSRIHAPRQSKISAPTGEHGTAKLGSSSTLLGSGFVDE